MAKRESNRLSAKAVQAKRAPGYYADGAGLYLQISDTGTKSWIFRYVLHGRAREMGLGALHTFSLAEARERATAQRKLLADGVDPIDHRDAGRAALMAEQGRERTFADCAAAYVKAHRASWKNAKHAEQWTATLDTYCASFARLPVSKVDTPHVLKALEPIWTEKAETASRLRARIERVLAWATVSGYRKGDNPARWRGHLDELLPKIERRKRVKHHPALPYPQLGEFIQELRAEEGTPARALEFAILTAARTSEVLGAKPAEFDLQAAVWTIPAERMKSHRRHKVPLSAQAVAIVREALKAGGEYVFPGRFDDTPLSNMAMLQLTRRMRAGVVPHGFRSTFRTWAAEQTNYARDVCEMALAHVIGDQTEAAYQRGDLFEKRRRLMAEWARFCEQPVKPAKVTPIRKSA
jgi:integrase